METILLSPVLVLHANFQIACDIRILCLDQAAAEGEDLHFVGRRTKIDSKA
jgi:hypothetical protein